MQRRVAVIGTGYVGTVAAACLAHVGHQVVAVEVDQAKLASLAAGRAPFYEPGLDPLVAAGLASGRLRFTSDFPDAMRSSDIVFVCVGTPSGPDGNPDLSAVTAVAHTISANLDHPHIIVNKSTVPVGTGRWFRSLLEDRLPAEVVDSNVFMASNPEFLREGNSVYDFLHPDRIVLGSDHPEALEALSDLYAPILGQELPDGQGHADPVPLVLTNLTAAELIKYASNAFLATKISFANEMARICDFVGADVTEVTAAMGLDPRIGPRFLDAGLGWGGSCFPKDILALVTTASDYGYHPQILSAALAVNKAQRQVVLDAMLHHLKILRGARIGVLGIAFKPGTDDRRESAALEIIRLLQARSATVVAHDPMISDVPGVVTVDDPYQVADGADAILVATEWPEYLGLDLAEMRRRAHGDLFFDGRNIFSPHEVRAAGFEYLGIGRAAPTTAPMARAAAPK